MDTSEIKYTLRFPFKFGTGTEYPNLRIPIRRNLGNLILEMVCVGNFYFFEIYSFDSEEAAKDYLNRVWAGMAWVSLNNNISFSAETVLGSVTYYVNDSERGIASGNQDPLIYPTGKKIQTISGGGFAHITSPFSFEDIYPLLVQGIEAPNSFEVLINEKFKTALDLYNAYNFEHSANARFLTLIMALEVFTVGKLKNKIALELIDKWKKEIEEIKDKLTKNGEEYESLKALERELLFRKDNSLRSQIRSLVHETLEAENNPEALEIARKAVELYDKRSTLVHDGILSSEILDDAERKAKQIVEMILKAKFRMIAHL